ncbi:MAG: ATP-binding cassette domain-containing protein [Mycoplasmataceae bacterium]|nr:ATP-binding cassette domain-containing protein [Mycoplasmataceae bacterium]
MENLSRKVVEFRNVNFGYTKKICNIKNVSFDIYENEFVCIIGHNGSGKSTISKLLTAILKPWNGIIKIYGNLIDKSTKNHVGIIFQNPDNQFVGLTTLDDIAFGLENKQTLPSDIGKIIKRISKMLNIEDLLDKEPINLSSGQKQKVAIASILAIEPDIFIFDESTSMLDPISKIEIRNLMLELKNKYKKTVISITHNMDEVVTADKVFVMEGGCLVKTGVPKDIFSNYEELVKLKLDLPFYTQISLHLSESKTNPNLIFSKEELFEVIKNYGKK